MTTATLDLLHDESLTVADLAARFGESEAWIAGALDAVEGGTDWRELFGNDDGVPSEAEREDYAAGFAFGLDVLEDRNIAEGWDEAYAMAALEAARAAELVPVGGDDEIPW